VPASGSGSAYVAVEHPASGFALAGAAALVRADGSRSVALTGVGARPILLPADVDPLAAVGAIEIFGDSFAPIDYRQHLASTVVRRALEQAVQRAEEAQ
jgi:CO/xanthine dehydrogenase FAD-binding subunit